MTMAFLASAALVHAAPRWRDILEQPPDWYGSAEARATARIVQTYQTAIGGWPKNLDMTRPPSAPVDVAESTIDNGATTTQLWLLGRIISAPGGDPDAVLRIAAERGIDYLLAAQYPNGGWPQFFPLRRGYYSHITFNDDAMVRVLRVLQAVAEQREPFGWVDPARRERAAAAVARGVECILRCQVRVEGQLTAWCAQHDAETFAPAPARKFEPISLSGMESVGILEFLMAQPASPELVAAIEAGVAWLDRVKLTGWRIERPPLPDGSGRDLVLVKAAEDAPPVWARFYEIGTDRPIFMGRDGVAYDNLAAVEPERRSGYAYYGTWGASLLAKAYPQWKARRAAPEVK